MIKKIVSNPDLDLDIRDNKGKSVLYYVLDNFDLETLRMIINYPTIKNSINEIDIIETIPPGDCFKIVNCLFQSKYINLDKQGLNFVVRILAEYKKSQEVMNEARPDEARLNVIDFLELQVEKYWNKLTTIIKLLIYSGTNINKIALKEKDPYNILSEWWLYLPKWSKSKHYLYPSFFKKQVKAWLLVNNRKKIISKDIISLIIEYIANTIRHKDFEFFVKRMWV